MKTLYEAIDEVNAVVEDWLAAIRAGKLKPYRAPFPFVIKDLLQERLPNGFYLVEHGAKIYVGDYASLHWMTLQEAKVVLTVTRTRTATMFPEYRSGTGYTYTGIRKPEKDYDLADLLAELKARATTQEGYKKALTAKHVSQLKAYGLTWDQLQDIRFRVGRVSKEDYDEE